MSLAPAMSSPHEYRELMRAQFRMGGETRTVEQVAAEHKAKRARRRQDPPAPRSGRRGTTNARRLPPAPAPATAVPAGELAKLQAMLTRNRPS